MTIEHVLITGAAGTIGSTLRTGLAGSYRMRLIDIAQMGKANDGEELIEADITSLDAMENAASGIDAIIHLGAIAYESNFNALLGPNFIAVYNIFEAAYRKGVKRVIFASSNHAIGLYPTTKRIGIDEQQRPDSYYGVGKAFGENLGLLYHTKWALEVVNLRIGSFLPRPTDPRHLSTWLSHGDMVRLTLASLKCPAVGYATIYGVSANTRSWWDNPDGVRLGYLPLDNAEDYASEILANAPPSNPNDPAIRLQGGPIAAMDFGHRESTT